MLPDKSLEFAQTIVPQRVFRDAQAKSCYLEPALSISPREG
jgi:hypothetical protein